jgi:hypothetical protein
MDKMRIQKYASMPEPAVPNNSEALNPNTYKNWQMRMMKSGVTDNNELSEISYIKHILEGSSVEDVDIALSHVSKNISGFGDAFPYLLADLYSKKGDVDMAKEIIIDNTKYRHRDNDMINSVKNLITLHPEIKEEFIANIKTSRPEFYAALSAELK